MRELRQVISEINVLEARNAQLKEVERDTGKDCSIAINKNLEQLRPLYDKRASLMKTVDVTEPQYMM